MSEWLFASASHPPLVLLTLASENVARLNYRPKDTCIRVRSRVRWHVLDSTAFFVKAIGMESNRLSHTLTLQIYGKISRKVYVIRDT